MGLIEDIKRMQLEGRSEQEITSLLQSQGHATQEVYDALAQARIKEAVAGRGDENNTQNAHEETSQSINANTMQPSLLAPQDSPPQKTAAPEYSGSYAPDYANAQQNYNTYAEYTPGASADTIAEIAEQVVAEKMHDLRQLLEKILEFRAGVEAKVDYLDERLKRIERTIDQLQSAILQRVGEHMSAVSSLKSELSETQKSFKALLPEAHRTSRQQSKSAE